MHAVFKSIVITFLFALVLVILPRADQRPPVIGRSAGVSAGHPLTTAAAFEILLKGGNAFDAGVAAMLVGGVVEQDLYSLGGEGLVLVYPQSEKKVTSIVGQGWAPKGATIDWYPSRGKTLDGDGSRSGRRPRRAARRADGARAVGDDEFRAGRGAGDRIRREGFPLRPRTGDDHRTQPASSSTSGPTTSKTG